MTTALATSHPGAVSTPRLLTTAEEINSKHGGSLSCHLLFFAEISGGKGNGQVPTDDKGRKRYFRDVRAILKREYQRNDSQLAGLISEYQRKDNGPILVRRKLLKLRPDKQGT